MTETALKVNSHRFELYRAYSIFGQFVKSCQIFLKLNSKRQYQSSGKENESRLAFTYVLHKTFTLQSCSGGDECTKKRGAQAKVLFCQSVDFCRSRCCRRCSCLSLLFFIVYLGIGISLRIVRMLAKTKNTVNSSHSVSHGAIANNISAKRASPKRL